MNTPSALPLRCVLFVPGSRSDRFDKAAAADADAVCLDLEDAVAAADKPQAREDVVRWLASSRSGRATRIGVRCNALSTIEARPDLQALAAAAHRPDFLMVPKVDDAAGLKAVHALWPSPPPLLALIETSAGVLNAAAIARRSDAGLLFGAVDLAAELGADPSSGTVATARTLAVLAARAARVDILDTPCLDVQDDSAVAEEARQARGLGFSGKAAIHPRQVPIIQAAFSPTEEEVAEARRTLAAFVAGGGQAMRFEGRLLERPIVERHRRTLALAARAARDSA